LRKISCRMVFPYQTRSFLYQFLVLTYAPSITGSKVILFRNWP
jgi:hypothetical protein